MHTRESARLLTLVGRSGTGKTTHMRGLIELGGFRILPAVTTRAQRPSDLKHEYNHVSPEEFERLARIPGRFLTHTVAGNGDRYGKDICDLIEAFTDPEHIYIHALTPEGAVALARKYGREMVRTVLFPSPGDEVLQQRMLDRGDAPAKVNERLIAEGQQFLDEQFLALDGLYVIKSHIIPAQQAEILDLF